MQQGAKGWRNKRRDCVNKLQGSGESSWTEGDGFQMQLLSYGVAVTVGSLRNVRVKPLRAAFIGGDVISQMDGGARAGLKLSRLRR